MGDEDMDTHQSTHVRSFESAVAIQVELFDGWRLRVARRTRQTLPATGRLVLELRPPGHASVAITEVNCDLAKTTAAFSTEVVTSSGKLAKIIVDRRARRSPSWAMRGGIRLRSRITVFAQR